MSIAGSDARAADALQRLLRLMRALRDPATGCPWDLKQTHETLSRYAIEEAYETADAIASGDLGKLRDELGDLLFQVVFHAQLGGEKGSFDFADVADAVHDKLERRHPHVFARGLSGDVPHEQTWEAIKAGERAGRGDAAADRSVLADIPLAAPALTRAAKLGSRAATVGFDWENASGVRAKVAEELDELEEAMAESARTATPGAAAHVAEEVGDLLFTVAHWARHLRIDPESALRAANAKFERRFRAMEALAAEQHKALRAYSPAELEVLWQAAKRMPSSVQAGFTAAREE